MEYVILNENNCLIYPMGKDKERAEKLLAELIAQGNNYHLDTVEPKNCWWYDKLD